MKHRQRWARSWHRVAAVTAAVATASAVSGVLVVGGASVAAADTTGEQVVLQQDFSGGSLPAGWNAVTGNWRVENGRLVGTGAAYSASPARITFGQHLENYRFDATVRFESVDNTSRWQALALDMAPDGAVPWQHAAMRTTTTATNGLEFAQRTASNTWNVTDTAAAPTSAGTGKDVHVSIVVEGTHGEWWFEGQKIFETENLVRSATGVEGFVVDGATVSYDDVTITQLPDPNAANIVLSEDFSGGVVPAGWTAVNGNWRVENGRLLGTGGSIVRITFGQHLENFRYDATVRFEAVNEATRWQALALDIPANGGVPWQQAAMRSGTTAANGLEFAQRTAANAWYVPATSAAPTAAGTGKDVQVSIVVQGTHGEWWFNGQKVFETDGLLRSTTGVQGLVVDGSTVSYDNIRITRIDPLPPAACVPVGTTAPGQTGLVIAHRGDSAAYPENTLPAMRSAFAKGADYLETDIDWSSDGVPFLMHDDSVDRTTDGTGANHSLTIAQIRQLDAGSWKGAQFAGTPVPTLEDLLAWMKQSGAKLLLEYKGDWPVNYIQTTRDLIEQYGVRDQVIAQGFSTTTIDRLYQVHPELPTMILANFPADPVTFTQAHHAIGLNPDTWPSKAALEAMRAAGLKTFVWTENSATAWASLTALGVDGIITDLGGELVTWRANYNATPHAEPNWCEAPDTDAPAATASLTGAVGGQWLGADGRVVLAATDEGSGVATVEYRVDGGAWVAYSAPFAVPAGQHQIEYRATDKQGNVSAVASLQAGLDATVPAVTVATERLALTGAVRPVKITLTAQDADSGVAKTLYRIDDGAEAEYTGPFAVDAAGEHTVTYRAVDRTGNASVPAGEAVRVDGAKTAPAKGVLSSDEGWDTGLSDGTFNVMLNMWYGENATSFELYQAGERLATLPLTWATPGVQKASFQVGGLPNGQYTFTGVLINSVGRTETTTLRVTVDDANPARPVLSHDNWDNDGSYQVTANLWWGTNATGYRFFENGVQVAEGALTAASPEAQKAVLNVTGRAAGTYRYTAEFRNAAGATTSDELAVTVR